MDMSNALTVDVEDYYHVAAFDACIACEAWKSFPSRVRANTRRALELFESCGVKATFFILGCVAEDFPDLVREVHAAGHEIASHGYGHQRIYCMSPEDFRQDVRSAKALLEDIAGTEVRGYRAPTYSITRQSLWALDVLMEEGYGYDSSIFPVVHDNYGIPDAPRHPFVLKRPGGSMVEFPLTTCELNLMGKSARLPVAGGGYLRLLPSRVLRMVFSRVNAREGQPGALYFHPWELDPDQPRLQAGFRSRFRHYLNLDSTAAKLKKLVTALPFAPMGQVVDALSAAGLPEHVVEG